MANNRMYLRCKACGEITLLAKSFLAGYRPFYDDTGRIDAFFQHHWRKGCEETAEGSGFDLAYENDMTNEEMVHTDLSEVP